MATSYFGAAFFSGEFFFGAAVVGVDTHDGFDGKRKEYHKRIEARERLRTQLEEAFANPKRLAKTPVSVPVITVESIAQVRPAPSEDVGDDEDDWLLLIQ